MTTALLLVFTFFAEGGIIITKRGGGINGYSKITEQHNGDNHSLDCRKSGYEQCEWTNQPSLAGYNEIINVVEGLINSGAYNGSQEFDGGIVVNWNGTSPNDVEIVFNY